jgi:hypothetical protein
MDDPGLAQPEDGDQDLGDESADDRLVGFQHRSPSPCAGDCWSSWPGVRT